MAWRPECNEAYSKRKLRHGNWKILLGGGVGQTQLTVLTYTANLPYIYMYFLLLWAETTMQLKISLYFLQFSFSKFFASSPYRTGSISPSLMYGQGDFSSIFFALFNTVPSALRDPTVSLDAGI
jgi:hypothetical protein